VLYWIAAVLSQYGGFGPALGGLLLLGLILVLSLFFLPFSLGVWWLAGRSEAAALLAAPALWVAGELLRTVLPAGGFPWGAVGYSQYPLRWLVQIADLGGIYLISFLVLAGNCALLAVLQNRYGRSAAGVGVAVLLANLYGACRLAANFEDEVALTVDLVQPVIRLSRERDYYSRVHFQELPEIYRRSGADKVDWVVLPEAPNPFPYGADFYYTSFWNKLAIDFQVPVLLNSTSYQEQGSERYNSVYLVDEKGRAAFRYDKTHLVPFGEYLPYGSIFGFARPLVQYVGGYTAGKFTGELGTIRGQPFGALICYEIVFPSLSRNLVNAGARMLVNVTNDHWFGETSAPRQHLEMAAFRAIENRRPILRSANSGFSALIDATGSIRSRTELNSQTVTRVEVRPGSAESLFSLWGQALNVSLIMIVAGLVWRVCRKSS
jgi:apolipoprotein N-acyltransferase